MRPLATAIVAAGLALGGALSVHAADLDTLDLEDFQVKDGTDLLELCSVSTTNANYKEAIHLCHGYMRGAYAVHEALAPKLGRVICPAKGTTWNDGQVVFVTWAKAHPDRLGEPAVDALAEAWKQRFPCPKG